MPLALVSFVAGVLTVLAPCTLPLLPVIVGGGASESKKSAPYVITGSLVISIFAFTLLIQAGGALVGIPDRFWQYFSGGLISLFGLSMLWPGWWERLVLKFNLASNRWLGRANQSRGIWRLILLGAALGPVFTSCSPTYALILATVLPVSFAEGALYMLFYALGLGLVLLATAKAGQAAAARLAWLSDPHGWFKRSLGAVFVLLGLAILSGLVATFEAWLVDLGVYDTIADFEFRLTGE
ncbi:MAG TPA: cytochrome c biogenesis protein CcdA [Candidatus Saccharimonadales bacterium]